MLLTAKTSLFVFFLIISSTLAIYIYYNGAHLVFKWFRLIKYECHRWIRFRSYGNQNCDRGSILNFRLFYETVFQNSSICVLMFLFLTSIYWEHLSRLKNEDLSSRRNVYVFPIPMWQSPILNADWFNRAKKKHSLL